MTTHAAARLDSRSPLLAVSALHQFGAAIRIGGIGIAAGWSRWGKLRLNPPGNRITGWIWPICFVLIGFMLLSYREA